MSLTIVRAPQIQANEITRIINNAYWPSHRVFLDETNKLSQLRVTGDFISAAITAEDKEFYLLVDSVSKYIFGTILLQKEVQGEPGTAKFNLLARNPDVHTLKVGDILMNHVFKRVAELGKAVLKIDVVVDFKEGSNKLIEYYEQRGFCKTGRVFDFPRKHSLKPEYYDRVYLIELQKAIQS